MSRHKILSGIVIAITLVCLCLILRPFFAYGEDLSRPPQTKKALSRLEGVLSELQEQREKKGIYLARQFAEKRGILLKQDNIRVILEMKSREMAKTLQLPGATIEKKYGNLVQISIPLNGLKDLIALPGINFIREPMKPLPHAVISEGVEIAGANNWHNAGFEGQDVKVAVLDCTGFAGYQDLLGTELPPADRVVVRSCRGDGLIDTGNHGTMCAEVVYDMAPGATLFLVNYNTELELGYAVDYVISQDIDIITHSVGWLGAGPGDGTGMICNMVNDAHDAGILWANSVGNQAQRHLPFYFNDSDGDDLHEFAPGPDETIALYANSGQVIVAVLSWNDWGVLDPEDLTWSGSIQDYDFHLYRQQWGGRLTRVASSTTTQNGTPPVEGIVYNVTRSGYYHLVVENYAATGDHYMEIYSWNHDLQYQDAVGSLTIPSDAAGSFSVGAAYWQDKSPEFFSSWGPPNTLGGNPPLSCSIENENIKPEILGPDGVSTVTTGTGGFYGSSSSSPHVAGAAAILLSSPQCENLTPDELRTLLMDHATNNDYGTLPDCEHGYGFLTMPPLSVNNSPVATNDSATTDEDTSVTIDVLANDTDEDNDPLSVTNLTQPANGTAALNEDNTVTYTPNANFHGSDSFTYTAYDGTDTSDVATVNITVNSVNDTPVATNDLATTVEDTAVTISVLANDTDEDNDPLSVTNLTQPANGTAALNADNTVTYTPNTAFIGEDAFTYTAYDGTAYSNVATVSVTVSEINNPPNADAGSDQTADEGASVNFDGSGSSDSEGTITSYEWDFGDGYSDTGITVSHVYADNDTYTITLTVTDDDGDTDTDTATVTIDNVAPSVEAGTNQTVNEGDTVSFSGSFSDPGSGDTHTIEWDFGDSTTASGTLTPTHVYGDNGNYTVSLRVTDDDGDWDTDTLTVTVNNVEPIADAGGPYNCIIGEEIAFTGNATDPGVDDALTYSWDFGDESTATGQNVSHTYTEIGTYTVTLTVTDDDGGEDTDTTQATVNPSAPTTYTTIDMSKRSFWKWWRATAVITVKDTDASGLPIAGTTVNGHWSDAYSGPVSGTTKNDGTVSFRTGWISTSGTVAFTIDEVSKDGYVYTLSGDGETTDSISN